MGTEDADNGLYGKSDDLDGTNNQAKFKVNRIQFESDFKIPADDAKPEDAYKFYIWTYPGKHAAGIVVGKGDTGCVREMCNLSEAQWKLNFGYYDWVFKYFGSFVRPTHYDKNKPEEAEKYAEYAENPFKAAEVHGVTRNPLPPIFLADIWFWVALICNVCQNWFSTLLSKTLSSLWKNIFAAVSLACVIVFDKFLLKDSVALRKTQWDRVIFAMGGVLVTVMLFNLLPKEKPHPPPGEKKEESAKH